MLILFTYNLNLRIALPKGSLWDEERGNTESYLVIKGFGTNGNKKSRDYFVEFTSYPFIEARFDRPKNMPERLCRNIYDIAIMGGDENDY